MSLLGVLFLFDQVMSCPDVCRCIGTIRVSVYCDFLGLEVRSEFSVDRLVCDSPVILNMQTVPAHLPISTSHLYLNGNRIQRIVPEMFIGEKISSDGQWTGEMVPLVHLKTLRLELNPIEFVSENSFVKIPGLEMMYVGSQYSFIGLDLRERSNTSVLPQLTTIQRQALSELKYDKETFDGFHRVPVHPLEVPNHQAFSVHNYDDPRANNASVGVAYEIIL